MPLDDQQLSHLAHLARLQLDDEQREEMRSSLESILDYFVELQGVDTEGLEPLQRPIELFNVLRPDEAGTVFSAAQVQALAPKWREGSIELPRTLEE